MGDAGSLVLGYALSVIAIMGHWKTYILTTSLMVPILVLGYPIFDTALVSVMRIFERRSIFQGGKDHSSHRLALLGLKRYKTGALYRVEKVGNGYELKETRKGPVAGSKVKKAKADGPTRNELMLAVKAKKIANFRVMNKEELAELLKPGITPSRIKAIQEGAVKRWKSGWKFDKKQDK